MALAFRLNELASADPDSVMITSYQSYTFFTRDINETLRRTAQDPIIAREAQYYRENIGSIKTVDDFLADDRIYNYAMKAYGLEEMAYAKALIRQVLESDLTDTNSFANRLQDAKYKALAEAFDFGNTVTSEIIQTTGQMDALIDTYSQTIEDNDAVLREETAYYKAVIGSFTQVDDLFYNTRARDYVFSAFGIDPKTFDYNTIRSVLTSDVADPNSYVNAVIGPQVDDWTLQIADLEVQRADPNITVDQRNRIDYLLGQYSKSLEIAATYFEMAATFNFNADGTLSTGVEAQNTTQIDYVAEKYVFSQPRLSATGALLNKAYYEETLPTITSINDLMSNSRMLNMALKAFDLPSTTSHALLEWALAQDPDDPNSTVNDQSAEMVAMVRAFNFGADGNVLSGMDAQDATQLSDTMNNYMVRYNDADEEEDLNRIAKYKLYIGLTKDLDDFLSNVSAAIAVREFALDAFNISPDEVSTFKLKQILTSDPYDPDSYVSKLKDERFLEMTKAFNFRADGSIGAPRYAQTESEITRISKAYYVAVTRLDDSDASKRNAEAEASYYRSQMQTVESIDDLVADVRLKNVLLVAEGLRPVDVDDETLKQVLASDLSDPDSFANQLGDIGLQKVAGSFNFDAAGNVQAASTGAVQNDRGLIETERLFLTQTVEELAGEESIGARLALYFERMAPTVTSVYEILADEALAQFVRTTFSISDETASANVDIQKALIEKYLDIDDLVDPEKLDIMVKRFLALYDLDTGQQDPLLAAFNSGGSFNIETVATLSQLRAASRS